MTAKQNIESIQTNPVKNNNSFVLFGAISGMVGGILLMSAGLILSAEIYFTNKTSHGLEVVFLALSFFFFGIGAHCLDLIDKEKRLRRK